MVREMINQLLPLMVVVVAVAWWRGFFTVDFQSLWSQILFPLILVVGAILFIILAFGIIRVVKGRREESMEVGVGGEERPIKTSGDADQEKDESSRKTTEQNAQSPTSGVVGIGNVSHKMGVDEDLDQDDEL